MNALDGMLEKLELLLASPLQKPHSEDFSSRKEYLLANIQWKASSRQSDDLTVDNVAEHLAPNDFPKELVKLYRWRSRAHDWSPVRNGLEFISLHTALELYKEYADAAGIDPRIQHFWPIFASDYKVDIGFVLRGPLANGGVYAADVWGGIRPIAFSLADYLKILYFSRDCLGEAGDIGSCDPFHFTQLELDIAAKYKIALPQGSGGRQQ